RGERFLRAEPVRVEAGFRVTRFAGEEADLWAEGKVGLRARMDSGGELEAVGWEEITDRPFRQDVSLAGASSRCDALWTADFPERGMRGFRFAEYGDADGDGLPNWFEMLYFGRGWLDWERQTAADPDGDENGDGVRNAEHFRNGTNPVFFAKAVPFRSDEEGRKSGRSRRSGRVTIQAE